MNVFLFLPAPREGAAGSLLPRNVSAPLRFFVKPRTKCFINQCARKNHALQNVKCRMQSVELRRTFSGFIARPQTALCGKRPQFAENFRLIRKSECGARIGREPRKARRREKTRCRAASRRTSGCLSKSRKKSFVSFKTFFVNYNRVSPPYRANRSISFARFARNQESLARGKPRFSAARHNLSQTCDSFRKGEAAAFL